MPKAKKQINIRVKGANGEREILNDLNFIIRKVMTENGYHEQLDNHSFYVQRNQNQSAVGGKDLINTYGYAIEVKRQENLAINSWWRQCKASAEDLNEIPVLLYKQNRKPWKCITEVYLDLNNDNLASCRGEIEYQTFLTIFKLKVEQELK